MADDNIITLYDAANELEAGLLRDALTAEGVEATIEQTPSPFDGAGALGGTEVFVRESQLGQAREILQRFVAERSTDET